MEASARASLNFLEQLYIFHRQQGSSGIAVPNIGGRPLDLWRLKREVTTLGGYNAVSTFFLLIFALHPNASEYRSFSGYKVSNGRKWAVVAKIMGYNVQLNTAVCSHIKTAYLKIVVPFEDYVKRVKLAGGTPPPDPTILHDDFPSEQELSNGADSLATPCPEVDGPGPLGGRAGEVGVNEKVRTASDKLNEVLYVDGSSRSACLCEFLSVFFLFSRASLTFVFSSRQHQRWWTSSLNPKKSSRRYPWRGEWSPDRSECALLPNVVPRFSGLRDLHNGPPS